MNRRTFIKVNGLIALALAVNLEATPITVNAQQVTPQVSAGVSFPAEFPLSFSPTVPYPYTVKFPLIRINQ